MNIITTSELKKLIDSKKADFVLIDVRDADELVYGMIPSARHIPLFEIEEAFRLGEKEFKQKYHFKKPDKKKKIILYCRTGGRSRTAMAFLRDQGYNAVNYTESVYGWANIDLNVKTY